MREKIPARELALGEAEVGLGLRAPRYHGEAEEQARVEDRGGAAEGALPLGAEPACTIELPRRGDDKWSGWVYQWHPTCLEETAEGLEALLEETVMKFKHERTFYMEVSIEGILGMPCTMSCTMSCTM